MKAVRLLVLAVSICGLGVACAPRNNELEAARSDVDSAKLMILAKLKDPNSAQWGTIWTYGGNICGYVNARNSFGGYVGPRRFHVVGDSAWVEGDQDGAAFGAIWSTQCDRAEFVVNPGAQSAPTPGGARSTEAVVADSQRLIEEAHKLTSEAGE